MSFPQTRRDEIAPFEKSFPRCHGGNQERAECRQILSTKACHSRCPKLSVPPFASFESRTVIRTPVPTTSTQLLSPPLWLDLRQRFPGVAISPISALLGSWR